MATDYILLEDGFKLILEDASGDLILESSGAGGSVFSPYYYQEHIARMA